jgi:hypothetical protein
MITFLSYIPTSYPEREQEGGKGEKEGKDGERKKEK